ncbi:MAG: ribonuclease H-like domain-containing protein [Bacteroidota bacterium]
MPSRPLVVAWDLETVPLPDDTLTDAQRRRLDVTIASERRRHPDLAPEAARRKAASLHPFLGWICCLSAVRLGDGDRPARPKSYTAASPADEAALLRAWWADAARLPRGTRFVTFNGKRFDADWLRVRSAAHGIAPTRADLLDTYPYNHQPHADLARTFGCAHSLDDLCDLLGVERSDASLPPDGGPCVSGPSVAEAVRAGRLDAVARYCEADVRATLECYARLTAFLS